VGSLFYNYHVQTAGAGWETSQFLANLLRIYSDDRRCVPPQYALLRRELKKPGPHLARLSPLQISIDAHRARKSGSHLNESSDFALTDPSLFEIPVAAAVAMKARGQDPTLGALALLRTANDAKSLERCLEAAGHHLRELGCQKIIASTGLSLHLESGVLQDSWQELPPLYSPYNPPYLPDLLKEQMEPLDYGRLFHVELSKEQAHEQPDLSSKNVHPLDPIDLTGPLLPLFQQAFMDRPGFLKPDRLEAEFILHWWSSLPIYSWQALDDSGLPAGFVLIQPDLAPLLQAARGGRGIWSLYLKMAKKTSSRGLLLAGAVSPEKRGRGYGKLLWRRACQAAMEMGWRSMTSGPHPVPSPAASFLESHGAQPRQSYQIYQKKL
jgi:GNAT superfamily N-acetyltransferase